MASENDGEMSREDMCEYLREKGLGRWADAFKGTFLVWSFKLMVRFYIIVGLIE